MPLLFIDNWFDNAFIQALGWTLFHSLWQGFLLVVLVALSILLTRRSTATVRYRIFSSLFFIFLGSTVCTFLIEYSSLRPIPAPALLTGNEIGDTLTLSSTTHTAAVDLKVPLPGRLAFYFNEYGPWLMMLWFIVFLLKSIRLGINYAQVQRIRNENRYVLPAIEKRVNELAKHLGIRRTVKLRETTSITVPVTMGFLKPLILIPCGLINNLPPDQVEAILLHELAHIRRLDYLVNLLQCLAETVFFFNPAVLWLSSLLREERENCCDDIAITVTQNKSLFIHALVAFQEYHVGHPMAPGLKGNKYPLLKRIQRIVYNNNKKLNHMEKIFLALGLVVTGIVALAFNSPSNNSKEKSAQHNVAQKFHSTYATKDSIPESWEFTGTVVRTIDGKKYRLVVKDNKPAELYVDEKRIPEKSMAEYEEITEQLMEHGRARFHEGIVLQKMKLEDGNSRLFQKRNDEILLLDKITKEDHLANQLKDNEQKLFSDKMLKLSEDQSKENELFNQNKKMELQDKFMRELQSKELFNNKNADNLFNNEQNKKFEMLLLDKLQKEGENELLLRKLTEESELKHDLKLEDNQKLFQLQLDKQLHFDNELNKLLNKTGDTSRPRKPKIKGKGDDKNDEYEEKQREIEERKRDMEREMREKDKDYNERLREMAEYRAMLERELKQTQRQIDREKKNADKARKEDREELEERRIEDEKERKNENKNRDKNDKIDEKISKSKSDVRIEDHRTSSKRDVRIENRDGKEKIDVKIEERGLRNKEMAERAKERTAERRAEMEERRKEAKERRDDMIKELKEDGIIGKDEDHVSIQINDDGMTVNGVKQPEKVFNKYRDKFRKTPGKPVAPKPKQEPVRVLNKTQPVSKISA